MKTYFKIPILCLIILSVVLASCNSSGGGFSITKASGLPYEIVVSMGKASWTAEAGEAIKADLESYIPGLPQPESAFRIMYSDPKDFRGILTYVRNILIVDINDKMYTNVALKYENDRWASGQVVLTMNAPDSQSIVDFMTQHPNEISKFFNRIETGRAAENLEKSTNRFVNDSLKRKLNVMVNVPADLQTIVRTSRNFFWATNDAKRGRTDLIVYTFPYTDAKTFTDEYLVAKRDSVLKQNVEGVHPDSYMTTETKYSDPVYTAISDRGKYCGVLRGLWKMVGDMMGGPFVSHIRLDEENHRVVVIEGFVYAPETNKRNYIRKMEASLFTLRLPGEFDEPVTETLKTNKREIKE
jgi:hypothetical protein